MKVQQIVALKRLIAWLCGMVWALLLVRLVLRVFAARPDNGFVAALYAVSGPLVAPLTFLDARQPRFGSVLELSTLALVIILPVLFVVWRLAQPRARRGGTR